MSEIDAKTAELAERFREAAPEHCAALATALAESDYLSLIDRSHRLAGLCGMIGFPEIGECAVALEEAARAGESVSGQVEALLVMLKRL